MKLDEAGLVAVRTDGWAWLGQDRQAHQIGTWGTEVGQGDYPPLIRATDHVVKYSHFCYYFVIA